jgi:hypothetical protein
MQKLIIIAFAVAIFAPASRSQKGPMADFSVGYSQLFLPKGFSLTMPGGSVTGAFYVNHWLGVVGDFGAYDGSSGIPGLVGETYIFGPRFSLRKWHRLTPFAQAVIGGGHANSTSGGFLGARNAFAFGAGAGGDLGLDRAGKFALRGQLEYLNFRTAHNLSPDPNTGAVRLSAGVVFRFGRR